MASDTSLVFNLIAKDQASGELSEMGQRFNDAAMGIGVGVAAALGVGIAANLDMEAANAKLAAQLGVGPAEAAELSKISASVYQEAWGESTAQVNDAIKGVYQNIGDVSKAEGGLEGVTTKALALASTFDQDLAMSTAAVGQMIRTGLADNADEAFDILAVGLGTAADKAGDLLETFNEYSTQFRRVGLDGQTATGLIAQGLKAGARDADQVADAIGQFGERALAGGTAIDDAFKSIGLDADDMAKKIGAGGSSAEEALQMTTDALRGTSSEQVKLNAAAALFGDPGNVMGASLFALDPASAAAAAGMGKAEGAMDKLVDTAGGSAAGQLESFKRKVVGELSEAGGAFIKFSMENRGVMGPLAYILGVVAGLVVAVAVAQRIYATYTAIATVATNVLNSTLYRTIAGYLRLLAVGLMAYVRLAAAAVASAATTAAAWLGSALAAIGTWIAQVVRAGLVAARQFLLMAARAIAWAATMAAQWLIAMGPIGLVIALVVGLVVLIIANWDRIKAFTGAAWDWIWGKIKWAVGMMIAGILMLAKIPGMVGGWFKKMGTLAINHAVALVLWLAGLPGRAFRALAGLAGKLASVAKTALMRFRNHTIAGALGVIRWLTGLGGRVRGALSGAARWLYNAGRSIIQGLVNGIKNMASSVTNAVSGVLSKARNLLPFSPAKEGPFSGRGWTLYSGQSMMAGLAEGIEQRRVLVTTAMDGMARKARAAVPGQLTTGAPMGAPLAAPMGGAQGGRVLVEFDFRGMDEEMAKAIRKMVRVRGRGNVQTAFGTRGG